MGVAFVIQQIVDHFFGLFYAFIVCLQLSWSFIKSPIRFITGTFFKRYDVMPKCLTDPSLGTHGFIHLEDVKLHYVANGDESKPLMLFLHGFPEFWYSWRHQMREFSKDYRVVAVDQRGYADSDKPSGYKNYSTDKLAKDVKQLVHALGYESCILVGHDWGGAVAWAVAMEYPEVVDKLVVMNCPHTKTFAKFMRTNKKQRQKSWYMLLFQIPFIPELRIRANDFEMFAHIFSRTKDDTVKKMKATDEDIDAYRYAFSQPGASTGALNWYRAALKSPPRKQGPKGDITMPTLMIWGCPDVALSEEMAALSGEYVKDYTLKYIENSSHFVQTENPEEVNSMMREFLSGNN